jgi:hypothetical protein
LEDQLRELAELENEVSHYRTAVQYVRATCPQLDTTIQFVLQNEARYREHLEPADVELIRRLKSSGFPESVHSALKVFSGPGVSQPQCVPSQLLLL